MMQHAYRFADIKQTIFGERSANPCYYYCRDGFLTAMALYVERSPYYYQYDWYHHIEYWQDHCLVNNITLHRICMGYDVHKSQFIALQFNKMHLHDRLFIHSESLL